MQRITRIVAAIDGSPTGDRALPIAAALADQAEVPITLLTVAMFSDHVADAREAQRAACVKLRRSPECELVVGTPIAGQLVSHLQDEPGSLLVMATHARPAVTEFVLGSVAEGVVRSNPYPTVLVGPHVDGTRFTGGFADLVVCLDASNEAERLLPVATRFDEDFGLHTWLFEVIDPPLPGVDIRDSYETSYVRHVLDKEPALRGNVDWDIGHDDDPAAAILRFTDGRDSPIIALATRSRKPHQRFHEASTTVRVARNAPCPVLVIGPAFAEMPLVPH